MASARWRMAGVAPTIPGMPTVIRNVLPAELSIVLAMNESAVPHVNSIDLAQMQKFHAEAAYFRVAIADDEPAAFLVGLRPGADYHSPNFRWFCARYPDFAYIDRVAVSEAARRHGLGAALYRDFEATFAGLCPRLACEVNLRPVNDASMQFHRRMGFEQVGSQEIDGGAKEVAMLIKNLTP
jgi:predicted GNAT superfamily acetyltransferase